MCPLIFVIKTSKAIIWSLFSFIASVTNLGKGRPRLETGATDDGLLGYLKQTDTIRWWYNMIND